MKTKDKKAGIKNQKKSLARYKSRWVKNLKGKNECFIVEKPSVITTPLKESAKAMKVAFPHSYEDVIEPTVPIGKVRERATVHPIRGKPELHTVTKPDEKAELALQIAKLEEHMQATAPDVEGVHIKPVLTAVPTTAKVEDIRKSTPKFEYVLAPKGQTAANDLFKYGSVMKDTGAGRTPSGMLISDFLEGGKFPPKKAVLHSVTSDDYTYEELAELYDMQQVEHLEKIASYESRIEYYRDLLSQHEKDVYDSEDQRRVSQFNEVHDGTYLNKLAGNEKALRLRVERAAETIKELQTNLAYMSKQSGGVTEIELQEDLAYLRHENSELRSEIEGLQAEANLQLYAYDQVSRNNESNSKATLNTLSTQYNIYASQHRDDPVLNFFRRSTYCESQAGDLRKYFDDECNHRVDMSNVRGVFRKWASNKEFKKLGRSVTVRNEVNALRRIGRWAAIIRPIDLPHYHCKKLLEVTQCNPDTGAGHLFDTRLRPLTSGIDHDAYCKVWDELTYVMTRSEFVDWEQSVTKQKLYDEVSKTPLFKIVKPLVTAGRKVSKVLNYELSSKKRNEATRKAASERSKAEIQASSIKRMREEQFDADIDKEVIRRRMCGLPDHV